MKVCNPSIDGPSQPGRLVFEHPAINHFEPFPKPYQQVQLDSC